MTTTPVMTITDEQIAEIEKLSKRATPGDWVYVEHIDCDYLEGPRCEFIGTADNIHDGYYMASVNPSAILSIISRLRAAEKDRDRLDFISGNWFENCAFFPSRIEFAYNEQWYEEGSNLREAIDAAMEQSK